MILPAAALIEALCRTGSCIKSPSLVASALVILIIHVFIAVRLWLTVALA